jgi:hypothetical protein
MTTKRANARDRLMGGEGGWLAVLGVALLAAAMFAGAPSTPAVQANDGNSDLRVQKDVTEGDHVKRYRISARIVSGELSATDQVTIIDNLHVDMSFQGIREVGPGWDCSLQVIPESEGAFLRCILKDRNALTGDYKTVVRYDACDLRGEEDSGMVENGATIFLNDEEKAEDSAVANLPECKDSRPAATPTNTPPAAATSTPPATPISISPPSTGEGGTSAGGTGETTLFPLAMGALMAGIGLLVWWRRPWTER